MFYLGTFYTFTNVGVCKSLHIWPHGFANLFTNLCECLCKCSNARGFANVSANVRMSEILQMSANIFANVRGPANVHTHIHARTREAFQYGPPRGGAPEMPTATTCTTSGNWAEMLTIPHHPEEVRPATGGGTLQPPAIWRNAPPTFRPSRLSALLLLLRSRAYICR